ncbi:MAG: protein kinase [Acidobacteriota bacterium]
MTPSSSAAVPAERTIGRYRLHERLGAGGMGTVYRGRDPALRRTVAMKRIRPERAQRADARARMRREAQATARLSHPSVAQVYDVVETEDTLWIVLELIDGEPLHRLARHRDATLAVRLEWLRQIADGLKAAHARGILHRDLKRENVMITRDGRAKILDFGLALPLAQRSAHDSTPSLTTVDTGEERRLGTPRSMSPEQILGDSLDERSDLFAFGVLAYECLSGRSPFTGGEPLETMARIVSRREPELATLVPTLPPQLTDLVARLLSKEPAGRPQSAGEVARALERILAALDSAAFADDSLSTIDAPRPVHAAGAPPSAAAAARAETTLFETVSVPPRPHRVLKLGAAMLVTLILVAGLLVGGLGALGALGDEDTSVGAMPDTVPAEHFDRLLRLRGQLRASRGLDALRSLEAELRAFEHAEPELAEVPILRLRVLRRLFALDRDPETLERAFGAAARARALAPQSAQPVLAEAEVALDGHRLERAEQLLAEAERLGAAQPQLDTLRAWWLRLAGRPHEAVGLLHRQALHRTSPEWLYELAHLEVALGEHDAAREHLETLLAVEPNNGPARRLLAQASLLAGDLEQAASLYRALLGPGDDLASLSNLALVELLRGRPAEALPLAQRAVDAAPRHAALRLNLADVLRALGRHDEAAAHDERVLELTAVEPGGDSWQRWSVRAQALAHRGRDAEARNALARAHALTDRDELRLEAAATLVALGDLEAAAAELRRGFDRGLSPVWLRLPAFQPLAADGGEVSSRSDS